MRPERISTHRPDFVRSTLLLAAVLCALTIFPALFAAAFAQSSAPATSSVTYNPQSFIQELTRLRTAAASASQSAEALRALRESIPASWKVAANNRQFVVPTDLLTSQLVKAERQPDIRAQKVKQALDYLDGLASETASLSAQSANSSDSARAKLNSILSRPEYAHAVKDSWWDKIRARALEMLSEALDRIFGNVISQASLGYVLLWIAVCAAAVFIAYTIFRRWMRTANAQEMALQAAAMPLRSWQEWIYAARESAARADYRMAVHCAYWAGVARLQELGALSPDHAKTPREYLNSLSQSKLVMPETLATRQKALHALTARLEKIWYGYHIATEADFRESLTQLETLGCRLP